MRLEPDGIGAGKPHKLEQQALIEGEWGTSDNNRRAKFYRLTPAGRARLGEEAASWNRLVDAITMAGGREVCFVCAVDEEGVVCTARVVSRLLGSSEQELRR